MSPCAGNLVPQVSTAQLILWLEDARCKLHLLQTGRLSVEILADGYIVKFGKADVEKLKSYIRDLEARIEGRRVGGAIVPIF